MRAGHAAATEPTPLQHALGEFRDTLSDDLNVAGAIGALNQAVARYAVDTPAGQPDKQELDALRTMLRALGVLDLDRQASTGGVDEALIETKINERTVARSAKDWAASDRIRDELVEMGIAIKDGPQGTTWTRIMKQ